MEVKIKSVVKAAIVYYHIETDLIDFPEFRRNESGQWERSIGESWDTWYDDGELEKAYQEYIAALPQWDAKIYLPRVSLEDGIYHIEYIDADHVRLTKQASS